jgi:ribonucleotide reductase alpha subunit
VKGPDGERVLPFFSETFERLARRQGFHTETLMAEVARRGSLAGVEGVPAAAREVFKTAHEIDAIWHVRHQAAFQKHTDNGVSKTINLPESATEADVAAAYRQAWDLGCLGITVFRDGCKGSQVLNVGLRAQGAAVDAGQRGVKPRPQRLTGATYRMETPIGTAFIRVNDNGGGEPSRSSCRWARRDRTPWRWRKPSRARLARAAAALSAVAAAASSGDQPALFIGGGQPRLRRPRCSRSRTRSRERWPVSGPARGVAARAGAGCAGWGSLPRVWLGHAGVRGRVQEVSLLRLQRVLGGGHVLRR